ncbi:unnamed protein product [Acanthoscelides obtectus]|uniref:Kinesin motor domain-containing protein n=1 Tax=Acanthoscelides obtectus TaxID=200917 RepID=A0A9P0QIN8_ACAOB|nr:unnamed protein product [Acanthoscelides obtectus]CAK1686295.1 Centromere-associated protein E [Acanthoscelides obtectus]
MENMMQGNKIRRVAATRMNERSSRSHTIFRIILESKDANQKDGPVHISYLNLMDLAGSERVSLTKAAGERLKEGANINKSLSVLGNVIRQLSEGKEFISYRDSKLTRLLSQALGGNVLLDAREAVVDNVDKVMENMMQGNKIRRVAATRMNERSSRSHTIFRIILESKDANQKDGPVHISYLNLMDLAGSERVSLTKAAGERLKEGANINKSLSVLGNVIRQLSEGKEFISYRDSKLTRLLSQALGGNAKSLIIGNVTLAAEEETRSTPEFAQSTKTVKNKTKVNILSATEETLQGYQNLTRDLETRLKKQAIKLKEMDKSKQEYLLEIERLKTEVSIVGRFQMGASASTPKKN